MIEDQTSRTRTITWQDPAIGAEQGKTMSGLAYLRALQTGELPAPPIAQLLGFTVSEVSEGHVVFTSEAAEYHYNPIGSVHGGVIATLLDSAMSCAIHSTLPAGTSYTTLEIKVNYIRAVTSRTGIISCAGTSIHVGGRVATAEGRLTDADGTLFAHGTTTCLLFRS
jgi:uncharacterized protein (TIGR00369 family)